MTIGTRVDTICYGESFTLHSRLMQTFLPYPSGVTSAKVLDNQRLGKQRVEALSILACLTDIYKTPIQPKHLDLEPGQISTTPYAFCTYPTEDAPAGVVWAWNPSRGGAGWTNHPAVKMWRGYEAALVQYSLEICAEWMWRGFKENCARVISAMADLSLQVIAEGRTERGVKPEFLDPHWWGNEPFHMSHQSNLVRKDPAHYERYFPEVSGSIPYIWPSGNPNYGVREQRRRGGRKSDLFGED